MPTEILMPALSPTMEEGTLAKWLVKEGDVIQSGDVIAEIETDKATMEVETIDDGPKVHADQVAVFNYPVPRDSVHYLLIDRNADRGRVLHVAQERGPGAAGLDAPSCQLI